MKDTILEYNTKKEKLTIPEYGRHIQNFVDHAKTIEDKEERQHFANYIVKLMLQMSPNNMKGGGEFEEKMWVHFFKIADYDIDVVPPNGVIPTKSEKHLEPGNIEYPKRNSNFRHFGQLVQRLTEKAIVMEEGPKKEEFKVLIGSFMKLAYKNWSREHYISDEVIKHELKNLSKGKLIIPENVPLNLIAAANKVPQNTNKRSSKKRHSSKSSNYKRSNSNSSNSKNYRRRR